MIRVPAADAAAAAAAVLGTMPAAAQYAYTRLVQLVVESATWGGLTSDLILDAPATSSKFKPRSPYMRQLELERTAFETTVIAPTGAQPWALDSSEFRGAVQQLALHRVAEVQAEIVLLVQHLLLIRFDTPRPVPSSHSIAMATSKSLFLSVGYFGASRPNCRRFSKHLSCGCRYLNDGVADRRGDMKNLRKKEQAQAAKIAKRFNHWAAWKEEVQIVLTSWSV